MGFWRFLSRKSLHADTSDKLESRPYDSTVASAAPVHCQHPVAGNVPDAALRLLASQPKRSHTVTDSPHAPPVPQPGPAPASVLGWTIDRPKTAPAQARRPNRTTSHGPPPATCDAHKIGQPVPSPRSGGARPRRRPSLSVNIHNHSNSLHGQGRGFVDVLDAQSSFNPADFRQRLQAAGAREYGEDVADRNVGENGVNVDSPRALAFYAQADPARIVRAPAAFRSSCIPSLAGEETEEQGGKRKRHSFGAALRTRPPNSSLSGPSCPGSPGLDAPPLPSVSDLSSPQAQAQALGKNAGAAARGKLNRIQSMRSYVPSGLPSQRLMSRERVQEHSPDCLRPMAKHTSLVGGGQRAGPGPTSAANRPSSSRDALRTRGSLTGRKSCEAGTGFGRHETGTVTVTVTESGLPPSRPAKALSRRQTIGYGETGHSDLRSVGLSLSAHARPGSSDGKAGRHNKYNIASPSLTSHNRFVVSDESVPPRGSSLRNLSVDSATTDSSLDSGSVRPLSRNTAGTSVDLDTTDSPSARATSRDRAPSSFAAATMPSVTGSTCVPKHTADFNMDDYTSSDEDDTRPPRLPAKNDLVFPDTELLLMGMQLLGLSPGPGPSSPAQPPARAEADLAGAPSITRTRSREISNARKSGAPSEAEEGNSSTDELSFDIPFSRRATLGGHQARPGHGPRKRYHAARAESPTPGGADMRAEDEAVAKTVVKLRIDSRTRSLAGGLPSPWKRAPASLN